MKRLLQSFILAGLLCIVSCSEDIKPEAYTYTKIFTGEHNKTWKLTSQQEWYSGDLTDATDACAKDDRFTFYVGSDHTLVIDTGAKKCYSDPVEADEISDTWSFRNASANITMMIPSFYENDLTYVVREATSSSMVLEYFVNEEGTHSYRFNFDVTNEE